MTRTYWAPKGQDWEFLGAFPAGHVERSPKAPQAAGHIIDIADLSPKEAVERMQADTHPAPPRLVGLPTAIAKRLQARVPATLPWSQLEGYVK